MSSPQVVTLHTRLAEGCIDEYEAVHAIIPPELDSALRAAGVTSWRIWRDGRDLFHWVEVENFEAMQAHLAADPVDRLWQQRIAGLLETTSDSSSIRALPLVWELPLRPA
ncbi:MULTISPECIES: L-rhamnose mutarotase [Cryobacterium]|uniref:L-rhamnose mutarotase n=1 Tax=Cryobacterium TaxID=69578 RepID=UPI001F5464E6|nr:MULTISPECIES: L-rhamnose mutarotase [Cryobacterium]